MEQLKRVWLNYPGGSGSSGTAAAEGGVSVGGRGVGGATPLATLDGVAGAESVGTRDGVWAAALAAGIATASISFERVRGRAPPLSLEAELLFTPAVDPRLDLFSASELDPPVSSLTLIGSE